MTQASKMVRLLKSAFLSRQVMEGTVRVGVFRGIKTMSVPAESVQIRLGLWERETYKYIRHAARVADWVIDIGAGSGELSLFFSLRTQANPVIAVEPWTADWVRQNILLNVLNHSHRINIVEKYLGTKTNQTRLDSLMVPRHLTGFIKLDADYAELDILKSGEGLLREAKPLLLVETHSAELERNCSDYLIDLGYEITIVPNAWWRIFVRDQRPIDHNRWFWAQPR